MPAPVLVTPSDGAEPFAMTPLTVLALVFEPRRVRTVAAGLPTRMPPPIINVPLPLALSVVALRLMH